MCAGLHRPVSDPHRRFGHYADTAATLFRRGADNLLISLVGPLGLEPRTTRLKVRLSYRTFGPVWPFSVPFECVLRQRPSLWFPLIPINRPPSTSISPGDWRGAENTTEGDRPDSAGRADRQTPRTKQTVRIERNKDPTLRIYPLPIRGHATPRSIQVQQPGAFPPAS